jgi:hypothetical protein
MYCPFCGTSLPKEALFCFKCGNQLISKGKNKSGELDYNAPTVASSVPDPYNPQEETQNPYVTPNPYTPPAPPPPRQSRFSPVFFRGFFSALLVICLLGGVCVSLLLKQGTFSPKIITPPATVLNTNQAASATALAASSLYTADWSNGLNGWYELPGFQDWAVYGGMLHDNGTNSSPATPGIAAPYEVTGISDYAVETEIQAITTGQPCFDITTIRTNANWFGYKAVVCQGVAVLEKVGISALIETVFDPKTDWHTYRLEAKGSSIRLLVDGKLLLQADDSMYSSGGKLGISSFQTRLNVKSYKVFAI